jgi:alpha-tubulin suppressor-like RCC1 family protein
LLTISGILTVWGKTRDGSIGSFPGSAINNTIPTLFPYLDKLDSKVKDYSISKEHGGLVTESGSIYTWGQNLYHKLGHLPEPQQTLPKRRTSPKTTYENIKFGKVEFEEKIKSVKCGFNHTLSLSEEGEVYSWGLGKEGALGHSSFENIKLPQKIEFFKEKNMKVKQIECGSDFSIALTENGEVYTWGSNIFGQLGLGHLTQEVKLNLPMKINFINQNIKSIFAGEDHCACVSEDGTGYVWGYGIDGRLGNKIKMNSSIPVEINLDKNLKVKISKIACGGHHTAFLSEEGNLYMCGNGRDGELGRGDQLESQSVPREEPLLVYYFQKSNMKVLDVSCGSSHTTVLTEIQSLV